MKCTFHYNRPHKGEGQREAISVNRVGVVREDFRTKVVVVTIQDVTPFINTRNPYRNV